MDVVLQGPGPQYCTGRTWTRALSLDYAIARLHIGHNLRYPDLIFKFLIEHSKTVFLFSLSFSVSFVNFAKLLSPPSGDAGAVL